MTADEAIDLVAGMADRGEVPDEVASRAVHLIPILAARPSPCDRPTTIREIRPSASRLVVVFGCCRLAYPGCKDCPRSTEWPFPRR